MAVSRSRVTGPILLPDGSPPAGHASVVFTLRDWDREAGEIVMAGPVPVTVTDGDFDVDLWRSASGERATVYEVSYVFWSAAGAQGRPLGVISLSGPGPYQLGWLLSLPAPVPVSPDVLAQAIAAAADAAGWAAASAGSSAAAAEMAALAEAALANTLTAAQSAQSSSRTVSTWSALAVLTGAAAGEGAEVLDADTGTHTDPVNGLTVANAGRYSWSASPAGWRWIGPTGLSYRATYGDVAAEVARATAAEDMLAGRQDTAEVLTASRDRILSGGPRGGVVPGMAMAVRDRDGRRVGWDTSGRVIASGARHYPSTARGIGRWIGGFMDSLGRLALGVARDGSVTVPDLRLPVATARGRGRWTAILADRLRQVLIGWQDGDLNPTAPGLGTWRDPAGIVGDWDVSNLRLGPRHLYATLHDGLYSCDVMQRHGSETLVPVERRALQGVLVIGQSNAGAGSGPTGALPLPYDHLGHSLMTEWYAAYGSADATGDVSGYDVLTPAAGPSNQAYAPGLALTSALAALDMAAGRRSPGYVSFTSWEGSQQLDAFFPAAAGHWLHENALAGAQAITRCADHYRGADLAAVLLIQGEAGAAGDYADTLDDWLDTVAPLYGAPRVLIRQTSIASDAVAADPQAVALAQLAVARARLGDGVTLTGPMYHLPLHDAIHAGNMGRLIGAEMDATALHGGDGWHPLWPVAGAVTRVGAVITVPMALPPGATGLALDDDWVAAVTARGLRYQDASGTIAISSVAVSGASLIVTLASDPGANASKRLRYALDPVSPTAGWAGGRGQIYAETGTPSPAALRGAAIPDTIRHYCVAFEETVP